jgi:alanine racemase
MSAPLRPTTLEIDLDAAADNVRAVRRLVGPSRSIFAVVKADGYGFGAAEMGAVFARSGADWLAVADLAEGVRLRARGLTLPILVYPSSLPEAASEALRHGLVPTLVDLDAARGVEAAGRVAARRAAQIDDIPRRAGLGERVDGLLDLDRRSLCELEDMNVAGCCVGHLRRQLWRRRNPFARQRDVMRIGGVASYDEQ